MVTILKVGETSIQLTGWLAYPIIVLTVLFVAFCFLAVAVAAAD